MDHPSAAKVAARYASKDTMEVGDRVQITTRRGPVEAIVTEVTRNWSARKYPWVVNFTTEDGKDYKGKRTSIGYADRANKGTKFLGRSRKKKILEQSRTRVKDRVRERQDRTDKQTDKLRELKIKVGDVVRYKYRNGTLREVVADINYRTGKIGIERFTEAQKQKYLNDVRTENEARQFFNSQYGTDVGMRKRRTKRWLPASGIVEVVKSVK